MEILMKLRVTSLVITILFLSGCTASSMKGSIAMKNDGTLKGFEVSPHWEEQVKTVTFEPSTRIVINAPSQREFDPSKKTQIIFYALPNGNSIEWTIGRQESEGLDWHYYIQHIGAQTRRLREVIEQHNIVVAYLEADPKSWPHWRRERENNSELIASMVDFIKGQVGVPNPEIVLSSHSGGGSFIFGYINGFDKIPDEVNRICFLDSNYGFYVDEKHGDKLLEWLTRSQENHLCVLAYDDREITFNGKKVVGPTGGTYRATHRMLDFFEGKIELSHEDTGEYSRYSAMNGQVDIIIHPNPDNKILHTVLVGDMSGFIHTITTGTQYENKAGIFNGPLPYEKWIQPF